MIILQKYKVIDSSISDKILKLNIEKISDNVNLFDGFY